MLMNDVLTNKKYVFLTSNDRGKITLLTAAFKHDSRERRRVNKIYLICFRDLNEGVICSEIYQINNF